jgi:hypothetical protein
MRPALPVLVVTAVLGAGSPAGAQPVAPPRYADVIVQDPSVREVVRDALANDAVREGRQRAWMEKQPAWPPTAAMP